MPALLLLVPSLCCGLIVGMLVWRYPRSSRVALAPAVDAAVKVGEAVGRRRRLRGVLSARLDPEAATGLALTAALILTIGGGVVIGALALLVRSNRQVLSVDHGAASWGARHATALSTHVLDVVTQLGSVYVVGGLALLLAAVETARTRSPWVVAFIVTAMGGEEILTAIVKHVVDRLRPTFNPAAATLGPSFPSGHSATSAAFYAVAALLLGRGRRRAGRALLAGLAVGLAVAVAASRVLLDVHWVSDVVAGLLLGWAWFALCSIAFGGRILRFGAAARLAARSAEASEPRPIRRREAR
jgi:membrane-associated phospholipid phosphatase